MDVRLGKSARQGQTSRDVRRTAETVNVAGFPHDRVAAVGGRSDRAGGGRADVGGFLCDRRLRSTAEGTKKEETPKRAVDPDVSAETRLVEPVPPAQPDPQVTTIFDGTSGQGWMLCNRAPVPPQNIQPAGLNPHGTGSYLVVYDQKLGDFVLDFDYKLTAGCNSGVFLRVSDLKNPVQTGIEVALDDSRHRDDRDSGAFYGLVAPRLDAQRPSGQWNHMTITAAGPRLAVSLNETEVSTINLDEWTVPGKRPDGSDHIFKERAIGAMARSGYLGFQDLGSDCWFKNIVLKTNTNGSRSSMPPSSLIAGLSKPTTPRLPEPTGEPYVETARFAENGQPGVKVVRMLPDGKTLLTTAQDKTVRLWDVATGRLIRRLWHPGTVSDVIVLPDGRCAATDCDDGYIRVWDLHTGEVTRRLVKHFVKSALILAVSPTGRSILAGGNESALYLWDVENGTEIRQFEGQTSRVVSLAFLRSGDRFASGGADGIIRLGESKSPDLIKPLERHSDFVLGLELAADGRHAVSSSIGQLILWDLENRKVVRQVELDWRQVATVVLRDDHEVVFATHVREEKAGVRDDGVLGIWDTQTPGPPAHSFTRQGTCLPGPDARGRDRDRRSRRHRPHLATVAIAGAVRDLVRAGKDEEAFTEIGKAVTTRPGDARLLIERGRLLAEMGRASEADADFTRAAQLAPDNPQLFLEGGWWAAGPYGPGLDTKTSIEQETNPDPSRVPPPSAAKPRAWRRLPAGLQGHVDLIAIGGDHISAYALAIVFSHAQSHVVVLAGADDSARIWLNGRNVLECPRFTGADGYSAAVTLEPGRNTILVKVANAMGDYGFHLRLSAEPDQFIHTYFRSHDWAKAADAYKQVLKDDPFNLDSDVHHFGAEAARPPGPLQGGRPGIQDRPRRTPRITGCATIL